MSNKVKVAIIFDNYLPISQMFNYLELVKLENIAPIVCTPIISNLEQFPFEKIFNYKTLTELKTILLNENVNIIHARFGKNGVKVLDLKREVRLPLLTSFHGHDVPTNRSLDGIYKDKIKKLFLEGEAFTAPSKNIANILIKSGCPQDKVFVHYSGIDLQKFKYSKRTIPLNKKIILLSVGRLVEKKGMSDLINAFNKVQKKYPLVHLRIAGDGPFKGELRKLVKYLKIEDKVTFLGAVSHNQVVKEMQNAHLFVLASKTSNSGDQEGIPNVLKEAMATGLPVISTIHGGIPEIVESGKSGLLVKEGDLNMLSKSILDLINTPGKWTQMGREGSKIITQSFDVQKQVKELERIYINTLQKK